MGPLLSMCLGYIAAILHVIFDVVGLSCVQVLDGAIPDIELTVIRLILQTCLLGIIGKWNNHIHPLSKIDFKWMGVAALGLFMCSVGYYGAGKCMPLANHGSLGFGIIMITLMGLGKCLENEPPGMMNILTMGPSINYIRNFPRILYPPTPPVAHSTHLNDPPPSCVHPAKNLTPPPFILHSNLDMELYIQHNNNLYII